MAWVKAGECIRFAGIVQLKLGHGAPFADGPRQVALRQVQREKIVPDASEQQAAS